MVFPFEGRPVTAGAGQKLNTSTTYHRRMSAILRMKYLEIPIMYSYKLL